MTVGVPTRWNSVPDGRSSLRSMRTDESSSNAFVRDAGWPYGRIRARSISGMEMRIVGLFHRGPSYETLAYGNPVPCQGDACESLFDPVSMEAIPLQSALAFPLFRCHPLDAR